MNKTIVEQAEVVKVQNFYCWADSNPLDELINNLQGVRQFLEDNHPEWKDNKMHIGHSVDSHGNLILKIRYERNMTDEEIVVSKEQQRIKEETDMRTLRELINEYPEQASSIVEHVKRMNL